MIKTMINIEDVLSVVNAVQMLQDAGKFPEAKQILLGLANEILAELGA